MIAQASNLDPVVSTLQAHTHSLARRACRDVFDEADFGGGKPLDQAGNCVGILFLGCGVHAVSIMRWIVGGNFQQDTGAVGWIVTKNLVNLKLWFRFLFERTRPVA